MKYRVNEIFYSIQGEGHWVGAPAVFIRLSGCNLKCPFCDTKHQSYTEMDLLYIINEVKRYNCSDVVLTGGEPTIHKGIQKFVFKLQDFDFSVQVETNGYKKIWANWVTCSPKKELDYRFFPEYTHELKYVVTDDFDFNCISDKVNRVTYISLQPESNKSELIKKCIEKVKENPEWRLSLQIQKLINIR